MKRIVILIFAGALGSGVAYEGAFATSVAGRGFNRAVNKVGERQFTADLFEAVDATTHTVAVKSRFKTDWAKSAAQWGGNYAKVFDTMTPQYRVFVKDVARQILLDDQAAKKAEEDAEINALK